jgi:hypothetical protein
MLLGYIARDDRRYHNQKFEPAAYLVFPLVGHRDPPRKWTFVSI